MSEVSRAAAEGPTLEQITAARNSALGQQQAMTGEESNRVASELKQAHKDALEIKARHDADPLVEQVQARGGQQQEEEQQGGLVGAAKSVAQSVTSILTGDKSQDNTGEGAARTAAHGQTPEGTDTPAAEERAAEGATEAGVTAGGSVEGEQEGDEHLGHGDASGLMHVLGSTGSPVMPSPYEPWSKAAARMSELLGSGRAIATPVEGGQRHLGDDEPDTMSPEEISSARAQLADEPKSLGEGGSHSLGIGESGAGANSVETAGRVSAGIVDSVKGAVSSLFTGPSEPTSGRSASDAVRETLGDLSLGGDTAPAEPSDAPGPEPSDAPRDTGRLSLPELLAQVVTNVAKNVAVATNEEEVLGPGLNPEAPVGGDEPAPGSAALAASSAGDVSDAAREAADRVSDSAGQAKESVKEGASEAAERAKDMAGQAKEAVQQRAGDVAERAKEAAGAARERVEEGASDIAGRVSGAAARGGEGAREAAGRVSEGAREAGDRAREAAGRASNAAREGGGELATEAVLRASEEVAIATSSEEALIGVDADILEGGPGAGDTGRAAGARDKDPVAAMDVYGTAGSSTGSTTGSTDAPIPTLASQLGSDSRDRAEALAAMNVYGSAGEAKRSADTRPTHTPAAAAQAGESRESLGGAAEEAKGKLEEAAESAKESAGGLMDRVKGAAESAREAVVGAFEGAKDRAQGATDTATDTLRSAAEKGGEAAEAAKEKASEVAGAARDRASEAADAARGSGDQVDRGEPKGGLARGWEELKHGGAKAPWATTQGETEAPQDITSNVERSKHLDDSVERRTYEGEVYKTSPGAAASDDQAATDQARAKGDIGGVVAGDKRQVTGTVPHDKPEGAHPVTSTGTPDRFKAGGHAYSGFGTGSAAPVLGNDDIKRVQALFYPPEEVDDERPMVTNRISRATFTRVEGSGDGSEPDRAHPAGAGDEGDDGDDEEIPVSPPAGLMGAVGSMWGRSWVAKAMPLRVTEVPYDPEADKRNDAEARAAYEHARQATYAKEGGHKDAHPTGSSASDAARAAREDFHEAGHHAKESAAYTREALGHGAEAAKRAAQDEAEAVRDQVGRAVNTAQQKVQGAKQSVRGTAEHVADRTRETAESAADALRQGKENVEGAVRNTADAAREKAHQLADEARDRAHQLGEGAQDVARRAREKVSETAEAAEDAARRARERAEEGTEEARRRARDLKERAKDDTEHAYEEARHKADELSSRLAREAEESKRSVSSGFAGIADAFKGLLGGLLSPFEREAAPMDEPTAAVHSGAPLRPDTEPIPEEQMGPEERTQLAAARHAATQAYMRRAAEPASAARSSYRAEDEARANHWKERASAKVEEAKEKAKEGVERGEERVRRAEDTLSSAAREVKERTAGVISRLEETVENVARSVTDAIQDFVEDTNGDNKERPFVREPVTNTADLLAARARRRQALDAQQGLDRRVEGRVRTIASDLRDVLEAWDRGDERAVYALPPSNTEDVLRARAQSRAAVRANDNMDRRFF